MVNMATYFIVANDNGGISFYQCHTLPELQ
jgi:hypothetical protein